MKRVIRKVIKFKLIFGVSTLVLISIFTIYFLREQSVPGASALCKEYSFINPRIGCNYKYIIDKKGYAEFKSVLLAFIEERKKEGRADLISVWFRDLEFGPTFGINDRIDFIPASLLKLPLVMTFFSLAEEDPGILEKTIKYSEVSWVPTQVFLPKDPIKKNKYYTIGELIEHSIVYSDNAASQLLYEYLNKNYPKENLLAHTYRDLGILGPSANIHTEAVNTKGYGSIFRLLYNGSFLNKDLSEKVLSLLSRADFDGGLSGGIPRDIKIAHKFGERYMLNGKKQLHDCGIIYYPDNPYQLCIMTRGDDYDDLKDIIEEISRKVYQEFDSRKLEND